MSDRPSPKIGLLLAGWGGLTASAVFAGLAAMRSGAIEERYGVTSHGAFARTSLPTAESFVLGGWDFYDDSLHDRLARHRHIAPYVIAACKEVDVLRMPAVVTGLDFPPPEVAAMQRRPATLDEGAATVEEDIRNFVASSNVNRTVVVYLGSPSRKPPGGFEHDTLVGLADRYPSALAYALGAVRAGASFVDFTPSFTLEYRRLHELAIEAGVSLAGRDGSTGQTMLKVTIAEMLQRRNLNLSSWYSTNLIGNHDGLVLRDVRYGETKLTDKREAIGLEGDYNVVDIRYMPDWGDRKESWDAVTAESWLGSELTVRINWRGSDSELAAPLVIDIARLLSLDGDHVGGLRPELGFFFKRPFEREHTTVSQRWAELVRVFAK